MNNQKNSGLKWAGDIPTHWNIISFNSAVKRVATGLNPRDNFDLDTESPFFYVTIRNFKNGQLFLDEKCDRITEEAFKIIQERACVEKGDILFASISKEGQCYLVDENPTNWAINESVFVIKPDSKVMDNAFLYFHLIDSGFYGDLLLDATGSTFASIKQKKLRSSLLLCPPLSEQRKIASVLKVKCHQVDSIMQLLQDQINKLQKYKQSVISEAIRTGVVRNNSQKDSGIEYIGFINASYKTAPIGSLFKIKKEILGREPDQVLSITQNGIKIKDIDSNVGQLATSYAHYQIVNIGDFAMNHMDLITGGVDISRFDGVTSPDYRVFVMQDKSMNPYYFLRVFQSYYKNKIFFGFGQGVANLGRWRLPATNWSKIQIPVPPIEEQNAIVEFLDKKCLQIDRLIEVKQEKLQKLEQYKKSLVHEYVTGKKVVS